MNLLFSIINISSSWVFFFLSPFRLFLFYLFFFNEYSFFINWNCVTLTTLGPSCETVDSINVYLHVNCNFRQHLQATFVSFIFSRKELAHWKRPWCWGRWRQEEKGKTEDGMVGCHHQLDGHEFEQAPGFGDGQGSLACCSSWCCKELDMTEWLNYTINCFKNI